jgi:hypothetical protein
MATALLGVAWVGSILFGVRALLNYESSPGRVGSVPNLWPADSAIHLADDRPTLIMLAHPQCPCTRASTNELAEVMARVRGKVQAYVLFYTPEGSGADWQNTSLRQSAAQIPGVTVLSDVDGAEARRFGAETSGHTFLFDPSGRLLFNGGITQSRGHSGDSVGENAIISLANNHGSDRSKTWVFGCPLTDRRQAGMRPPCLK